MSEPTQPALDERDLAEPVRRALGSETVDILDWQCETLQPGSGASSGGVYRVAGNGRDGEALRPWSLVLKILCRPGPGSTSTVAHFFDDDVATEPGSVLYWKREALAYGSGLLQDL